ncbi:MAG: helicase-related protein [Tenericutes bacterium]|nr:helicase-related protein [Mycoplasmatota bacterium]
MKTQLLDLINKHTKPESSDVIVLRGFDLKEVSNREIDISKLLKDKLGYMLEFRNYSSNILTYEEYIVMYELILLQYNRVIIINNSLFYNFYPLSINLEDPILSGMVMHYNDDGLENLEENHQIKPYLEIFSNIISINDKYFVTYNKILRDEKEVYIEAYEDVDLSFDIREYDNNIRTFDILDEVDYLELVNLIFNNNLSSLQIVKNNLGLDINELMRKISILRSLNPQINIEIVRKNKEVLERFIHPDLTKILKEYWKTEDFREVIVYDLEQLEQGSRKTESILQSDVVTNVVEQVERCRNGEGFRDVFVTASTGSGKSAMFQIPAIYLAGKYDLFTIVISPLIGLMQDQVAGLEEMGYKYSRTINSDISPIKKQEIIEDIEKGECNILYISPESLMGKSDLIQIIGNRKLGLLVIDEAHIVTTWGKQFRPDYWYLGDHVMKLRKSQQKREGMQFVIATFTATAIYGGLENMYQETIQSLNMIDPITYLGYVRRKDIEISVEKKKLIKNRSEYELDKFNQLLDQIKRAVINDKKILIYFPTVSLIEHFYDYASYEGFEKYIAKYHGKLHKSAKEENYIQFKDKEKYAMIATKAFGMGIDINDIEIVMHFAPTGNVCDYIQEIGRAARNPSLDGEAIYKFMSNDFKHINRLHGLSTIKEYQLIEVIKKVYQLHNDNIKQNENKRFTKKRNEMLVDAESFAHIFENPFYNEDDGINKVKTAMLLIQKDFERRLSYSPFFVRPIPLFEIGFFRIDSNKARLLNRQFENSATSINYDKQVYNVNLKKIWEKKFSEKHSFPKFKYMLYTKDNDLDFEFKEDFDPVLKIDISFMNGYRTTYKNINEGLKSIINSNVRQGNFIDFNIIADSLASNVGISKYLAKSIVDITLSAMKIYARDYSKRLNTFMYKTRILKSGSTKYSFSNATSSYFKWIDNKIDSIEKSVEDGELLLSQNGDSRVFSEYLMVLGILESYEVLTFKALGGRNSQLYIYVNQTKTMKEIMSKPHYYKNRLLELVSLRHELSVLMLTYLFDNNFDSDEIWNLVEDYFVGKIPDKVKTDFEEKTGQKLDYIT